MTVRIFFRKKGNIKYISHLDLMRAVNRALLRSELPIRYTEGFNPHPKLVFALPLSIYQESEYEIFDIDVEDGTPVETVCEKLKNVMPRGIDVFKAAIPKEKLKALSFAKYKIKLKTSLSAGEISEKLKGELPVLKKTKTKSEVTDIKPLIKDYSVSEEDGCPVIVATVVSTQSTVLNPSYIVAALGDSVIDSEITRICLYGSEGKVLE